MRLPRFTVRTLLILTTLFGVVFVVCGRWPVHEKAPLVASGSIFTISLQPGSGSGGLVGTINTSSNPAIITRSPTTQEWVIRTAVSSLFVLATFATIGFVRSIRSKRAPARIAPTRAL
jgi:hypothetical protein